MGRATVTAIDPDDAEGVLLGLACGDALGRPVEFRSAGWIEREHGTIDELLADGTHGQPAGTITDDTEQALCIARSLVECGEFDPADIAARFVEWYESGPFDIGIMTSRSLARIQSGEPWDEAGRAVHANSAEGSNAGNGSVMRCAPLAVADADDPGRLQRASRESSLITHADPRCTHGCSALNLLLVGLLREQSDPTEWARSELSEDAPAEIADVLSVVEDEPTSLPNSGYVVDTLRTAIYHGLTGATAEDAIVGAVTEGGDTDTIGAVAGAIAGARFGASALPDRWLADLDRRSELRALGHELSGLYSD